MIDFWLVPSRLVPLATVLLLHSFVGTPGIIGIAGGQPGSAPTDEAVHLIFVVGYAGEEGRTDWDRLLSRRLEREIQQNLEGDPVRVASGREEEAEERCRSHPSCDVVSVTVSSSGGSTDPILKLTGELLTWEDGYLGVDSVHGPLEKRSARIPNDTFEAQAAFRERNLSRLAINIRRHFRERHPVTTGPGR